MKTSLNIREQVVLRDAKVIAKEGKFTLDDLSGYNSDYAMLEILLALWKLQDAKMVAYVEKNVFEIA